MSLKLYEETDIQAIADATRAKTGTTDKYKVSQMPQAIADIEVGGSGNDGATYTPHVSSDGIISWTNDKGLPNPEPVNIKGLKGDKGDTGERGIPGETPVKGVDYWTDDDKAEISEYVDRLIGSANTALENRLNGGSE